MRLDKKFEVQQSDFSTSSSISPMGDLNDPPKWEEKLRRTQEKVRTWETVRRYVLENVTMDQRGGRIRWTRVRC